MRAAGFSPLWQRRDFVAALAALGAGGVRAAEATAQAPAPAASGAAAASGTGTSASGAPTKWIVGYPAGGGADFVTRVLAAQMGAQMRQTIEVVNMPGKGGTIAAGAAAKAAGDGHNLFTADNGILVYNASLFKSLPYDPDKDFALIGFMARTPLLLVASPQSGFTSLEQVLAAAKANPSQPLRYASPGEGSPHHLAMELLKSQTGLVATHVPYRGTGMAMPDVTSGKVPLLVIDLAGGLGPVRNGLVVPVMTLSSRRVAQLPNVRTASQSALGNVNAYATVGLVAPASTPAATQAQLNTELQAAMRNPEVFKKLNDAGWETAAGDPMLLRAYMAAERAVWPPLIKERGITVPQ